MNIEVICEEYDGNIHVEYGTSAQITFIWAELRSLIYSESVSDEFEKRDLIMKYEEFTWNCLWRGENSLEKLRFEKDWELLDFKNQVDKMYSLDAIIKKLEQDCQFLNRHAPSTDF